MKSSNKIGIGQLCCLFFVSRILALFMFILPENERMAKGDRPWLFLPFLLFGLLAAAPALLLTKNGQRSVFDLTDALSPRLTSFCGVLLAIGAVWSAAMGAARLGLFTGSVLLNGAPLLMPLLALGISAVIIAGKGLQTIGRVGGLLAALLASSLLFVLLTTAGRLDPANLDPPLTDGLFPFLLHGFRAVARTPELGALLVLGDKISGSQKKAVPLWLAGFGLTASCLFFVTTGVTGEYGERQMFQFYTLTMLSKVGVMERMDNLIAAVWVMSALLRTAFFLWIAWECLSRACGRNLGFGIRAALAIPVLCVSLLLSGSVTELSGLLASGGNEALFAGLVIFLPTGLLIAERIGKSHLKRGST